MSKLSARDPSGKADAAPKTGGFATTAISIVVTSAIAAGVAWFSTDLLAPQGSTDTGGKAQHASAKGDGYAGAEDKGGHKEEGASGSFVRMEPVVSNMHGAEEVWMRLELGLIMREGERGLGAAALGEVKDGLIGMLRNTRLSEIEGASGFLHFREDVFDLVRMRTNGKVKDVTILSLVVE